MPKATKYAEAFKWTQFTEYRVHQLDDDDEPVDDTGVDIYDSLPEAEKEAYALAKTPTPGCAHVLVEKVFKRGKVFGEAPYEQFKETEVEYEDVLDLQCD